MLTSYWCNVWLTSWLSGRGRVFEALSYLRLHFRYRFSCNVKAMCHQTTSLIMKRSIDHWKFTLSNDRLFVVLVDKRRFFFNWSLLLCEESFVSVGARTLNYVSCSIEAMDLYDQFSMKHNVTQQHIKSQPTTQYIFGRLYCWCKSWQRFPRTNCSICETLYFCTVFMRLVNFCQNNKKKFVPCLSENHSAMDYQNSQKDIIRKTNSSQKKRILVNFHII